MRRRKARKGDIDKRGRGERFCPNKEREGRRKSQSTSEKSMVVYKTGISFLFYDQGKGDLFTRDSPREPEKRTWENSEKGLQIELSWSLT